MGRHRVEPNGEWAGGDDEGLDGKRFIWPKAQSGPMMLNREPFDALFAGGDWRGIAVNAPRKPVIA